MPRPGFPQFENGKQAAKETAQEREALERPRILIKFPRDPLELARQAAVPAPIRAKSPKAKKEHTKRR